MRVFDSNGPDVRIRGTAWQVTEKYQALAKDAESAGNWVMAENYHQHAEHYLRIINTLAEETPLNADKPQQAPQQQEQKEVSQTPTPPVVAPKETTKTEETVAA